MAVRSQAGGEVGEHKGSGLGCLLLAPAHKVETFCQQLSLVRTAHRSAEFPWNPSSQVLESFSGDLKVPIMLEGAQLLSSFKNTQKSEGGRRAHLLGKAGARLLTPSWPLLGISPQQR